MSGIITYPYETRAFKVEQPMGTYYVAVLPAALLLDVCFSDRLRASKNEGEPYTLDGTQRMRDEPRLKAIGSYISRADAAFPNAVILAANSRVEDGFIETTDEARWSIKAREGEDAYTIVIPTRQKLAAVIDGQHRIFSFTYAASARLKMPMLCSIFFDLPKPYQAQLFATINSTQKPVDKSLTYELFGYNVTEEPESFWSPDKLAVFFARKLNIELDSPIVGRIAIVPENDFAFDAGRAAREWRVSMATVVEGIVRLVSSNPKMDANELLNPVRQTRDVLKASKRGDRSPLRELYLGGNDRLLYLIVMHYLHACKEHFWDAAQEGSFIVKTVGIQALFDILRELAPDVLRTKDASREFFAHRLEPASTIDFAGLRFRNASGSGRTEIKRVIREALGLT